MKQSLMKKIILVGICLQFLFTGTMASTCGTKRLHMFISDIEPDIVATPPDWAMGSFNGTFGILKNGNPSSELGKIEGYWESTVIGYSRFEKGRLQGEFFENESLMPNWNFSAKMFSKFRPTHSLSILSGKLTEIKEKKTYLLIGIGSLTIDGTFEFKIFTILNDNYYLKGDYILFKE